MGLKEAERVISSNHNKGRALGPSRLGAGEKELLCWKIKSLSLYLSTQTVSLIPAVCLLFINEPQKYGFVAYCAHGGSKTSHGRLCEILSCR